ncbi:membrane protein [Streptomyces sp. Amel2xB2]|nr:membrane protein [Streptomyces sp. Amel2xB2]
MEWLTKLPVIGPLAAWFFRTRVWRVYRHLDEHKWARHAASITFTSFISLFPMLAVFAAVGASLLTPERMRTVQHTIDRQVPGISAELNLESLADNAGTIGLIAGSLLVVTGVNWVGTLRESLRALWDLEEDPGNPVLLKLKDLGTLAGLGAVGLVSLAGSAFAVSAVSWAAAQVGIGEHGIGSVLLTVAGYAAALTADFALLWYVLTVLPRVRPPRRATVLACTMGALGFELLKLLLGGYLQGVATKSVYGAFGTPIALLLWISFMAKLMLFCTSWTATERTLKPIEEIDALGNGAPETVETERAAPVLDEEDEPTVSPDPRPGPDPNRTSRSPRPPSEPDQNQSQSQDQSRNRSGS